LYTVTILPAQPPADLLNLTGLGWGVQGLWC